MAALRLLSGFAVCALLVACGDRGAPAPHAADGHTHADGHAHEHAHDTAPEDVPIVRYQEESDLGPHGGRLVRLSSLREPDFGWAEVKWHGEKRKHVEVWLARDRRLARPIALDPAGGHRILLRFADVPKRGVGLTAGDPAAQGPTSHFATPPGTGWPDEEILRRFVRLQIEMRREDAGMKVLVSDDFELRPPPHEHESK